MAHHEEAGHVHAEIAGDADMLLRNVGFGAVGRDANRTHTKVIGALQFLDGADAGQDQRGEDRLVQHFRYRFDPLPIGVGAEAIVEARTRKAVAMRDFDCVDAGIIQRLGDAADMVEAVHVADGMHAIAQRHVLNVQLVGGRIELAHYAVSSLRAAMRSASSSPVALAAAVMMSRLPE